MQNRLVELRKERGLSRAALAAGIHVSYQTVYRWEEGDMAVSELSKQKLARFFHRRIADIFPEYDHLPEDHGPYVCAVCQGRNG